MQKLVLIRGLPGSSKSTIATVFKNAGYLWFEADGYFYDAEGNYNFNINEISNAHQNCQRCTLEALAIDKNVVVSNTFTTIKELKPYFEIASQYGIVPNVITCQNQFENVHNVPTDTLSKMKARFTWDISELFKKDNNETV